MLCMHPCSYAEEANADKAIRALTAALAPQARVMRDGRLQARLPHAPLLSSCLPVRVAVHPLQERASTSAAEGRGSRQANRASDECMVGLGSCLAAAG